MKNFVNPNDHTISVPLEPVQEDKTQRRIEYHIMYCDGSFGRYGKRHMLNITAIKMSRKRGFICKEFIAYDKNSGNIMLETLSRKNKKRQDALFNTLEQCIDQVHNTYQSLGVSAAAQFAHNKLLENT